MILHLQIQHQQVLYGATDEHRVSASWRQHNVVTAHTLLASKHATVAAEAEQAQRHTPVVAGYWLSIACSVARVV